MLEEDRSQEDDGAEELLRAPCSMTPPRSPCRSGSSGLPLSEAMTVIFHGRRDLGTLQTYVTWGSRGAGATVAAGELLRVPCDLDLAEAEDREEAERLYVEQATALRDALVGADTVLDVWREPLQRPGGRRRRGRPLGRAVRPAARAAAAARRRWWPPNRSSW